MIRIRTLFFGVLAVGLILFILSRWNAGGDDRLTAGIPEKMTTSETDIGSLTVGRRGDLITSIRIAAKSEPQKEMLRSILSRLILSNLTAQRTCTVVLSYGGGDDRGELYNCTGEKVGEVRSEEAGFLKDKIAEHEEAKKEASK